MSQKIDNIISHLTPEEQEEFLRELLNAIGKNKDLKEIISSWEATAEINAVPCLRDKILERKKLLHRFLLKGKHA